MDVVQIRVWDGSEADPAAFALRAAIHAGNDEAACTLLEDERVRPDDRELFGLGTRGNSLIDAIRQGMMGAAKMILEDPYFDTGKADMPLFALVAAITAAPRHPGALRRLLECDIDAGRDQSAALQFAAAIGDEAAVDALVADPRVSLGDAIRGLEGRLGSSPADYWFRDAKAGLEMLERWMGDADADADAEDGIALLERRRRGSE